MEPKSQAAKEIRSRAQPSFPRAQLQIEQLLLVKVDAEILNECLGKRIIVDLGRGCVLATMDKIGKNFVKLVDITLYKPGSMGDIRQDAVNLTEQPQHSSLYEKLKSLIVNRDDIRSVVPLDALGLKTEN